MKELVDKITSYNLFKYFLPGIIFVHLAKNFSGYDFTHENDLIAAFLYYFVGMVVSVYLLSGLIKCGRCGFNFSGQRYAKQRIAYYQDSGYINKGRSVCTSFLIRKEKIEGFVISQIKELVLG